MEMSTWNSILHSEPTNANAKLCRNRSIIYGILSIGSLTILPLAVSVASLVTIEKNNGVSVLVLLLVLFSILVVAPVCFVKAMKYGDLKTNILDRKRSLELRNYYSS